MFLMDLMYGLVAVPRTWRRRIQWTCRWSSNASRLLRGHSGRMVGRSHVRPRPSCWEGASQIRYRPSHQKGIKVCLRVVLLTSCSRVFVREGRKEHYYQQAKQWCCHTPVIGSHDQPHQGTFWNTPVQRTGQLLAGFYLSAVLCVSMRDRRHLFSPHTLLRPVYVR
jgi:hypothetical protein